MFGFGKDARARRDAIALMRKSMEVRARYLAAERQQRNLPPEPGHDPDPGRLAEELAGKAPKASMRRFAGQRLPSLSGTGLAAEAMFHGLDDLENRPRERRLVADAMVLLFRAANENKTNLTSADLSMLQVIAQSYERHPFIIDLIRFGTKDADA